jgi:hypothetical protein
MTVAELLADRKLTSALIVDDAYDNEPLAEDIAPDEEAWSNFIDDIKAEEAIVKEIFPDYSEMSSSQLRNSDDFVSALWKAKGKISDPLWDTLFDDYVRATNNDRGFLKSLETRLSEIGVKVTTCGRNLPADTRNASIVFADLFLGAAQQPQDIQVSIARLKKILKGREAEPPAVILMSRSGALFDKKTEFRDKAGLLGALFRVSGKAELITDSNLEKTLRRLAQHRPDALRVARFVKGWEEGLDGAKERFMIAIRRLDLSDYVQVREVLLNFEGQPLGSYLLDVFDRVLQHEIEGDNSTIAAAEDLNNIDPDSYAVPYIAKSPDLQDLVYRTIWQNPGRLKVRATECGTPVGFGDVLIRSRPKQTAGEEAAAGDAVEGLTCNQPKESPVDAYLVLTPACDLVREGGTSRVLLIAGTLSDLNARSWNYKNENIIRTPIVKLANGQRQWIKWDTKNLRLLLNSEISDLFGDTGEYDIVLRLRESNALEIQQKLLSAMGRVGLVAPMPATFEVEVQIFYLNTADNLEKIDTPTLSKEGGVCFVGRDQDGKENARLILTEQAIDEVIARIGHIDENLVSHKARACLARLKASKAFESDIQRGLVVPSNEGYKNILCALNEAGQDKAREIVGLIARNPTEQMRPPSNNAGIVIVLRDVAMSALESK